jgi:hypothetical protein
MASVVSTPARIFRAAYNVISTTKPKICLFVIESSLQLAYRVRNTRYSMQSAAALISQRAVARSSAGPQSNFF